MGLTILPDIITSDRNHHIARPATDGSRLWEVSWPPHRRVSRDNAITAMVVADLSTPEEVNASHWLRPQVDGWAAELALTGPEALTQIANPPRWGPAPRYAALDDPEADE